jgi:uncharacterized protein
MPPSRPLALVTGASTGIGHELARVCARNGYDLLVAANEPKIHEAAAAFRAEGAETTTVEADLATLEGVNRLVAAAGDRPIAALLANAGTGLGGGFLDQDFARVRAIVDTNVTGTLYLVQQVGRRMRERGQGRIMITGSIAGFVPGAFQAVYNASKAFLDNFSFALRNELRDSGVTVTCLMPGATETDFFERAEMLDTRIGTAKKQSPAEVAEIGFKAMMRGDGDVVTGWQNKLQSAIANVVPAGLAAELHRHMSAPGTGRS